MDIPKDMGLEKYNENCTKSATKREDEEGPAKQGFLWCPQSLKPDKKGF